MKAFAPTWFQYFPEQMPRSMMTQYAQQQGGCGTPNPGGSGRQELYQAA